MNEGFALIIVLSADSLTEGGGGAGGGEDIRGGEVRMYALCVGSVAATKSAKDKGFSRVFMGAKVGRKELCQGGEFFLVSDERRDFELGARNEVGMEG